MSEFIKDGWIHVDHPAVRTWVEEVRSRLSTNSAFYSVTLNNAFEEAEQSKPVELPAAIGSVARSTFGGYVYIRKAENFWETLSPTGYVARLSDVSIAEAVRLGKLEIIHDNDNKEGVL